MEHFYKTIGQDWFDYADYYSAVAAECTSDSVIVEVGSWLGRSVSFLAVECINQGKTPKIFCVDIWNDSWVDSEQHVRPYTDVEAGKDFFYRAFLKNIEPIANIITPIRLNSIDGASKFDDNSIDFCFIDANHEYQYVVDDINAWYPKVKAPRGIIAGHDYAGGGVKKAVHETSFTKDSKHVSANCWYKVKKSL